MKNNKKIIKAITRVVVHTMYQYGASVRTGKSNKNITEKAVMKEVENLINDDDLDYSDIVHNVTKMMLDGIKVY